MRWANSAWNNEFHWSNYVNVVNDRVIRKIHPYQKPVSLLERLILIHSFAKDVIVDPFCGSGSTLIAAINCNREYIGVEKSEKWYNVAVERVKNRVGRKRKI
jgi:DNA modification methylase